MNPVSTFAIWRLTWPTILSNMAFMLTGLIFLKIAGGMGLDEAAAVTTGQRLFFILFAVMMGLSSGTTALVGRYWGAENKIMAGRIAALSVLVFLVDGLLLSWVSIPFLDPLVGIFNLTPAAHEMAVDFVFYTVLYAPPMLIVLIFSMAFRATGDSTTPLWAALMGAVLGVYLGMAYTYGWHGLKAAGLSGLAIGNGVGSIITVIIFIALWLLGMLSFKPVNPIPDFVRNGRDLVKIGTPAAFEQIFFQGGLLVFLVFLASYGNAAFATYGIGLSILGLMIVIAFSFSISSATLVSQYLGAGDHQGAYNAGWRTMRTCVYIMILGGILMSSFAEEIARFMISDPEVVALLIPFTYIISCSLPLMGIEFSMAGALRGAGDTRYPMVVTVISIALNRILIPFILVKIGADVIWLYATSLLDFGLKSGLNMRRFRNKTWLKDHQPNSQHSSK
ncbi:MAG: MATE family efflux transporter [Porticoccaceae bacterium]|jgi:putative MATE family efflux protein|nr:MATE family efflux transporter [Porticoccaceae bacterium]MBT7374693.1 MATE family efflux transporter [Porticoccaceae bacterium]